MLDGDGALDGADDAGEFGKQAVAHGTRGIGKEPVPVAVQRFEPSAWLGLAMLGIALVGVAAWIERRARTLRPESATVRVSRPAEEPLSGWQTSSGGKGLP